ncbi:MAG: DUF1349 domain-containing protein, partial [Thermoanaerobaculales bacterium]|nr:DUF1349 domain-containing protein [Thermoanaerobaculales bacterium]
ILWNQATAHVGENVAVEGPVIDASYGNDTFYINLGRAYPDPARFTVTIPPECTGAFESSLGQDLADYFVGKTIQAYGMVELGSDDRGVIRRLCDPQRIRVKPEPEDTSTADAEDTSTTATGEPFGEVLALTTFGGGIVDPFDRAPAAYWTWTNEDRSHWSVTADGYLEVQLRQSGGYRPSQMYNLLIQPALDGDFTVETRVIFSPHKNFQEAGLILIGDDYNYFKIGRVNAKGSFCADCVGDAITLVQRRNGVLMPSSHLKATEVEEIYLRIAVESNMITASFSEDGARWEILNFDLLPWAPVSIGLYTLMGTEPDFEIVARFDYFAMQEGFTDIAMVIPVIWFTGRRSTSSSGYSGYYEGQCWDNKATALEYYPGGPELGTLESGCLCGAEYEAWKDMVNGSWIEGFRQQYPGAEAVFYSQDVDLCGGTSITYTHIAYDAGMNELGRITSPCFSDLNGPERYDWELNVLYPWYDDLEATLGSPIWGMGGFRTTCEK